MSDPKKLEACKEMLAVLMDIIINTIVVSMVDESERETEDALNKQTEFDEKYGSPGKVIATYNKELGREVMEMLMLEAICNAALRGLKKKRSDLDTLKEMVDRIVNDDCPACNGKGKDLTKKGADCEFCRGSGKKGDVRIDLIG